MPTQSFKKIQYEIARFINILNIRFVVLYLFMKMI